MARTDTLPARHVERALYTLQETSNIIGIPVRTLREWHYAKRIKTIHLGRRVMVPATTIALIVDEGVMA